MSASPAAASRRRAVALGVMAAALFEALPSGASGLLPALGAWTLIAPALLLAHAGLRGLSRVGPLAALSAPGVPAALLLTGGLALAAVGAITTVVVDWCQANFRDPDLLPLAAGGLAAAGAALAGMGVGVATPLLARALRRGPPAPMLAICAAIAAAALAWAFGETLTKLDQVVSLRPLTGLGVAVVVAAAVGATLRRARAAERWLWPAALAVCAVAGAATYTLSEDARLAVTDAEGLGVLVVARAHALGDADGDGFSRWLGGGDCDDGDPTVHPGAYDLADNGVDEDCQGGDRHQPGATPRDRVRHHVPEGEGRRLNVLLITLDAVRADALPCLGYPRRTLPTLCALAARSTHFTRAYTPGVTTRYVLPAMMAGRFLGDVSIEGEGAHFLTLEGNDLLFERLNGAGYAVEAHLASWLTDRMWYGLEAGTDDYARHDDLPLKKPSGARAAEIGVDALERLVDGNRPWALWLHLLDPHAPYAAPEAPFGGDPRARYDAELAYTDAQLAKLLDALRALEVEDETLVIVTADHGEAFGEHGRTHHGRQLYEEAVRVPLVVHLPGGPAGRSDRVVSLIDLPETIADLLGLPAGLDYGARSQADVVRGAPVDDPEPRTVFFEAVLDDQRPDRRLVGALRWPYKLIYDARRDLARLFDLSKDPREKVDLRTTEPAAHDALLEAARGRLTAGRDAMLARLRRGQVHAEAPPEATADEPVPGAGLSWLGGAVDVVDAGGTRLVRIRQWLRADDFAGDRPEVLLRLDYAGVGARYRQKRRSAPLRGLYPPRAWSAGEVIEDIRYELFADVKVPLEITASLVRDGETVFGPRLLGVVPPPPR